MGFFIVLKEVERKRFYFEYVDHYLRQFIYVWTRHKNKKH